MPSLLGRQSPADHVNNVKNTFSSWDTCMAKAYCKWPVIVGIVVGALILISVITCIARCICCGAECAICCCKCCTCCCGGGGGGGRGGGKGHQRMKSDPKAGYPMPYSAPPQNPYTAVAPASPMDSRPANQQYRSNAMPTFAPAPVPERPQYATFSSPSKPVNEDALPAMPTWSDGHDVHVEVEEPAPVPQKRGDMELSRLDTTGMAAAAGGARRSPGGPGRSPRSPHSARSHTTDSYGFPRGYQNDSFVSAGPQRTSPGPGPGPGPYGRPYAPQDEYRRGSPGPRAHDAYAQNQSYERRSPAQHTPYNDTHDEYYDNHARAPEQRYNSPSPPRGNAQNYNQNTMTHYDDFAPAPVPAQRSHSPGYTSVSDSTRFEPSSTTTTTTSAYPGQQSYSPSSTAYPGQQTYQAFQPSSQGQGYAGVPRKAVDGSYREV